MDTKDWPELWQAVYRILENNIVESQLQAWIQPLEMVGTEPHERGQGLKISFSAPNDFSAQWVRDHYKKAIETAFGQVTGEVCEVTLQAKESMLEIDGNTEISSPMVLSEKDRIIGQRPSPEGKVLENLNFDDLDTGNTSNGVTGTTLSMSRYGGSEGTTGGSNLGENTGISDGLKSSVGTVHGNYVRGNLTTSQSASNLSYGQKYQQNRLKRSVDTPPDPRYCFDNFVVGASNQFAFASAVAVAEQPAKQYNPLFLYSSPGLGKTHLLYAIGNHLLSKFPESRVAYLSAENFVNELIDSLQHRSMPEFRAKYRDSFDMILIDDIQFIAGKTTSEEEFFHTFNALYSSKRQIVVTCDRAPKEIEGLEERVRTRFEWGLVADISPPEIETRIAILKAKSERDDIYLPDDVATFLASHIKSNVRELEGVLIKLQAQASLTGAEVSLEMARQELKMGIPEDSPNLTVETIQHAVVKYYHLKFQDLKSTTRSRNIALPRQIAMFLIRKYTGMGFKEIGHHLGGKDHSTVMHGCKKIEKDLESNSGLKDSIESIQNLL